MCLQSTLSGINKFAITIWLLKKKELKFWGNSIHSTGQVLKIKKIKNFEVFGLFKINFLQKKGM